MRYPGDKYGSWMVMSEIAVLISMLTMDHTDVGSITAYGGKYVGMPLFCSTLSNPLYYDSESPPWVALPVKEYGKSWQCGDLIYIPGLGMFRALDAGPFGDHCVVTGDQCLKIRADVPVIHSSFGLSMTGKVINISAIVRACRERGYCDG